MKLKKRTDLFGALAFMAAILLNGCVITSAPEGDKDSNAKPSSVAQTNPSSSGSWDMVYENDFSSYPVGEEPDDLFILDGDFAVREIDGNKVLSLPGDPVGDFGILFGPRVKGKPVELRCRVSSTRKGRRMPAFAAALGGVSGYRLRLNPATRNLQLILGEETVATAPFAWESGAWTHLRFRAEAKGENATMVFAKTWIGGTKEPVEWNLVHEFPTPFAGGKCCLWGLPYASTEIRFDSLQVLAKTLPER
ncbi:MAG: hypothetical protein CMI30_02420 [Opitutae bacterium]|nr:hypothetical protein [Opitutae bacterium]|tara:strand:- start:6711 stop:7460 length:750 start_codon:yes stop_codon:yes gene_type:complete